MRSVHAPSIHRLFAAIAAGTTTFGLFSAVIAISEPHRSELVAANAARAGVHVRAQAETQQPTSSAAAGSRRQGGDDPTRRASAARTAAGHVEREGG